MANTPSTLLRDAICRALFVDHTTITMKKYPLLNGISLLLLPISASASLNFGGTSIAPAGTTIYYEGNQKGTPGDPNNIAWSNNMGPGGNVQFSWMGTSVTGVGVVDYTLDNPVSSFMMEVDYGFDIDNSGGWYDMTTGALVQGGSSIRFTGVVIEAPTFDHDGDPSTPEVPSYGMGMSVDYFDPSNNPLVVPMAGTIANDSFTQGGANRADDYVLTTSGNQMTWTPQANGGADGIYDTEKVTSSIRSQSSGAWSEIPGDTSNGNYYEVSKAKYTFFFVDFDPNDGVNEWAAGTQYGITLDGGRFYPEIVPEPSRALLLGLGMAGILLRRRRK